MTSAYSRLSALPAGASGLPLARGPRPLPLVCKLCHAPHPATASATCEECLGPLEPVYDTGRALPDAATIALPSALALALSRVAPVRGAPVVSLDSGFTPLLDSPALARRLGVARVWVKNDAVSHPSLSFKDRVVATALNAALGLGLGHRGLRLDRQPRQRGRRAGRARRAARLDLHPARPRARQGRGHRRLRPAPRPRARHLRRREPALLPGGGPLRLGSRQHQPARLLRRRLEDDGVRDRRAARLAPADGGGGADGGRLAADQAGEGVPRVRRGGARVSGRRRGCTALRRRAARRSCTWSRAAARR